MPADRRGACGALATGVVLLVVTVILMVSAGFLFSRWNGFERWPTVPGTVLSGRIEEKVRTSGTKSRKRTRRTWEPRVSYRYVVDGREYTGERTLRPGEPEYYSRADAQAFLDRNPVGAVRPVHHDPRDPQDSFLELSSRAPPWIAVAIAGATALAGTFLVLRGIGRI